MRETIQRAAKLFSGSFTTRCIAFLGLGLLAASCSSTLSYVDSNASYFTQFGVRLDGITCRSTNYRGKPSSTMIPINTEVTFVSVDRNRFTMRVKGGSTFVFEHVKKHTLDTAEEAFRRVFRLEPVDLTEFTDAEVESIEAGEPSVGMSRAAVLVAMGRPPAVGTFDQDRDDAWKYWRSTFRTFYVRFDSSGLVDSVGR